MGTYRVTAALTALLAALAIAAGTASASWLIAGSKLAEGSTAALASTAKVESSPVFNILASGGNVKITCKGSTLKEEGAEIIGQYQGKAKLLTFEGCETTEPSGCALEKQPTSIKTEPIQELVSTGPESPEGSVEIFPLTNGLIATLPFSSANSCEFNKAEPLLGAVTLRAPTLMNEATSQAVEGLGATEEGEGLEVGGHAAFIEGAKVLLKLGGGQAYSFRGIFGIRTRPTSIVKEKSSLVDISNGSGNPNTPRGIKAQGAFAQFEWEGAAQAKCEERYVPRTSCTFLVKFKRTGAANSLVIFLVEDANLFVSAAGIFGR